MKSLKLTMMLNDLDTLADTVRWPARLEYFEFDQDCYPDVSWSLAWLQPILYEHKNTLRTFNVYRLANIEPRCNEHPGLAGFGLHSFTALTHLCLTRDATGTDPKFISGLLAPRLQFFSRDLIDLRLDMLFLDSMGQREEECLLALAQKAVAGVKAGPGTGGAELRRITVKYTPIPKFGCSDRMYPWDQLHRVAAVLQQVGIEMSWDEHYERFVSRSLYHKTRRYGFDVARMIMDYDSQNSEESEDFEIFGDELFSVE